MEYPLKQNGFIQELTLVIIAKICYSLFTPQSSDFLIYCQEFSEHYEILENLWKSFRWFTT